jgi:O-antigen/teichoic acid export membrane protein
MKGPKLPGILKSEFVRNAFTLISGTSFAQGIAFAVYLVLPAIYTPEDFGLLALYMSILSITMIISTGKYELAIMLPADEEHAKRLLELCLLISAIISILLLLTILLFKRPFALLLGNASIAPWLYFIPLSTFMVGCFQAFRYFNNRQKKYGTITAANVGQSFTNSFVKLGMGPLVPGPAGLVTGTLIGQLTGFIIFLGRSIKSGSMVFLRPDFSAMKALAREYSLFPRFNMLQGLINNFSGALPIFVFTSYFSATVAGYFSLGYTIIYRPMNLVVSAFFQVLFQNIMDKHKAGKRIYSDIRKFLVRMTQLVIIPFIILLFLAPVIFRIFPEDWEEAGRYTQVLVPWLFMASLTMPLSFIPDMYKRQKTAFIIDLVKFVLRAGALTAGVLKQDVYLSLILFSGVSTIGILYSLVWYLSLVKRSDKTRE